MSEKQGQLFYIEDARERKMRAVFPPHIIELGDKLHDAGLTEEAGQLLDLHKQYTGGLEYYESLVLPTDHPDLPA